MRCVLLIVYLVSVNALWIKPTAAKSLRYRARFLEDGGNNNADDDDDYYQADNQGAVDDDDNAQNANQAYQNDGNDDVAVQQGNGQQNQGQSNSESDYNDSSSISGVLDTAPRDWDIWNWAVVVGIFLVWGFTSAYLCRLYHEVQESLSDIPPDEYSSTKRRRRRRKRDESLAREQ